MYPWELVIHFEELQEVAEELKVISGHVHDLAEDYGVQAIRGVKAAWGGENADAFVAKEVKVIKDLYEVEADLREVAKQLDEKAGQIYDLENSNKKTAQTRTYIYE